MYHNGSYLSSIATNQPSNGSYHWQPSPALVAGGGYSIRISSVTNPALYDDSNASFSISASQLHVQDDTGLTRINTAVTIDVRANDEVVAGQTLQISAVGSPSSGSVQISGGQLRYTPAQNFSGTASLSYTATTGSASASASVTITIVNQTHSAFVPLILGP